MTVRRVSLIAVALVAFGGAIALTVPSSFLPQPSLSFGQNNRRDPRPDEGMAWLQELDLSSDQVQRIQTVRRRYQPQMMEYRETMQQARQEFEVVMASEASSDEVRQKHRQYRALKTKLDEVRFESLLEIREVLTPAQRVKLAEKMQSRRARWREGDRPSKPPTP